MINKLSKFLLLSQFAISIACERNYPICGPDCDENSTSFDESSTIDNNLPTGDVMTSTSNNGTTEVNETTNYIPVCGDGILNEGEFCDNGLENKQHIDAGLDDCTIDCTLPFCGNDIVNKDEECDDNTEQCINCILCGNGIISGLEQCDDGSVFGPDNCSEDCTLQFVAFVTSDTFTGNFGGVNSADTICQNSAAKSPLVGNFKTLTFEAWLSDGSESPMTRFSDKFKNHTGNIIRIDETLLTSSGWNGLINGNLKTPLNMDEKFSIHENEFAWTGSSKQDLTNYCTLEETPWSNDSNIGFGNVGFMQATDSEWDNYTGDIDKFSCGNKHHFYCFSQ